jgi:transposase
MAALAPMGTMGAMTETPLPDEISALREALAEALARNESLTGELRITRTERDLLQEKVKQLMRRLFGASSEAGADPGPAPQKDLFFNVAESLAGAAEPPAEEPVDEDKTTSVAGHTRKSRRGRKPLDPALPREVVRHELPEDQRVCPHDGAVLKEIGVESAEQLDIIPQQVRVIRHERVKYACPCCDGAIRLAARPAQVIPKGLFTEGALAWIATSKYLDGLPLYRQAVLLGRFGGTDIARNTLAASMVRIGLAVQPVINLLRDELLESPFVFGDETELQVLKEPGRTAQAKSFLWAQMTEGSGHDGSGPRIRLFAYAPSRSTATACQLYAGIRPGAVLMTDGYEPYDAIADQHGLVHLGCWAHARRRFFDALKASPKDKRGPEQLPARFIELIGQLYHVEAEATREGVDIVERGRRRRALSKPILDDIEQLTLANLHAVLPKSLLGQALHYLAGQWPKLVRFIDDGRYSLDNNAQENAIRPFCVGRRNWLFADTVGGATASANLYSLLQTCVVNGIDAWRYLRALLVALPAASTVDDYTALLPWRMKLGEG